MVIFDIDGVVVDFTNQVFILAAHDVFPELELPLDGNHVQTTWAYRNLLTKEQEKEVWESKALHQRIRTAKPIIPALDIINLSCSPVFLTSRGMLGTVEAQEATREGTQYWLDSIGLGHVPLHHAHGHEKVTFALEHGAKIAWEDYPDTVEDYAREGIRCFMPVWGYNSHIKGDNIYRVEGWR